MGGVKEGGWGWLVMCCSFMVHMIIGGVAYSAGAYFLIFLNDYEENFFQTSWVGSILMAFTALSGITSSFLVQKIGYRMAVILGGGLAASGMALSVLCEELWHLYLTVGLLTGVGLGMALTPSVLVLDSYFYERRTLVASAAISGMSVGMMVFPVAAYHLNEALQWKGVALVFGGLCLVICLGGLSMRNEDKPQNAHDVSWKRRHRALRKIFEPTLLKSPAFQALTWSNFLWCFGLSIYLTHLPMYAIKAGEATNEDACVLIGILGLSTFCSRATFQLFSHAAKLDHVSNLLCTVGISAILTGLFPEFFKHKTGEIAFAIMLGLHCGYWTTFVASISEELLSLEFLAYGRGFVCLSISIGLALGAPTAGLVYTETEDYDIAFYLSGACLVVASLIMMTAGLGRCYYRPTEPWTDSESGSTISGFSKSSTDGTTEQGAIAVAKEELAANDVELGEEGEKDMLVRGNNASAGPV